VAHQRFSRPKPATLHFFSFPRPDSDLSCQFFPDADNGNGKLKLENGSRIGVIGSGPAGSFFSYFLLDMTQRLGIDVGLDIYDPRDFAVIGPTGCNMCGGIISESLVQVLAAEGVNLPTTVVQRGVDKKTLLRRIQQDPALAFRMLEHLCHRVRKLDSELGRIKTAQ